VGAVRKSEHPGGGRQIGEQGRRGKSKHRLGKEKRKLYVAPKQPIRVEKASQKRDGVKNNRPVGQERDSVPQEKSRRPFSRSRRRNTRGEERRMKEGETSHGEDTQCQRGRLWRIHQEEEGESRRDRRYERRSEGASRREIKYGRLEIRRKTLGTMRIDVREYKKGTVSEHREEIRDLSYSTVRGRGHTKESPQRKKESERGLG